MHLFGPFLCALISLCISPSFAADLPPITDWKEVTVPPETERGDYMVWSIAANHSLMDWRVFLKNGQPHALLSRDLKAQFNKLNFKPEVKHYSWVADTLRVDDGWLVGFNEGEWGGALYWFSPDGKKNYKISDHQVRHIFVHQNIIHAAEGGGHLGHSHGSIVTVTRPEKGARWKAKLALKLPSEPSAVTALPDRTIIVLRTRSPHLHRITASPPLFLKFLGTVASTQTPASFPQIKTHSTSVCASTSVS